jgi:hypothetical protein
VLLTGCLAVGHRLVHLVASVDHGLDIFLLQVLLGQLVNLVVSFDFALILVTYRSRVVINRYSTGDIPRTS